MGAAESPSTRTDPRELLSNWANGSDEWTRFIVRQVLASGRPLDVDAQEQAYALFRQEKALDVRTFPTEEPLVLIEREDEALEPLTLTSLSRVEGVNALETGGIIEPHEGLTILFGENGTGKTGYSRIFKALAASRTADEILSDISVASPQPQSATISYSLGAEPKTYMWSGQQGVAPFTRISIFDSPSVSFHVDDDLEYVYVPAALALFNHVAAGIKSVQSQVDASISELRSRSTGLLSRFGRTATVYPLIETLGASTDLEDLKSKADFGADVVIRIGELRRTVAALEADMISSEITALARTERALKQAAALATTVAGFDGNAFSVERDKLADLQNDYRLFRAALFEAADLPAEPDETWNSFVQAGEQYKAHLSDLDVHDAERCLYCRQPLVGPAAVLVGKYSEYLEDTIADGITASKTRLAALAAPLFAAEVADIEAFLRDHADEDAQLSYQAALQRTVSTHATLVDACKANEYHEGGEASNVDSEAGAPLSIDGQSIQTAQPDALTLSEAVTAASDRLVDLRQQAATRDETLAGKQKSLVELEAAAELGKSWSEIELHVRDAKQADRLALLAKPMPILQRNLTALSKAASDQMINESFDALFAAERAALRAPEMRVEYIGRRGKAHRRKVLTGKHRPSAVLSEGEQKVLAMADFLAEARLAGISAPVIFDDPVSSLDHRRINEVAQRIASLADATQVIVFTHDIFFATTLLNLMASTKRCSYFQITDEDGKGHVTRATGPRWDTLNNIKAQINETIQTAKSEEGDSRAALIRTGYDWIRSWCEVFTETELLQGVTQRYQPNVRMTSLPSIKTAALPAAIEVVNRVFEEACRYIDGHSQPLASMNISPSLTGLEAHWKELQEARGAWLKADG